MSFNYEPPTRRYIPDLTTNTMITNLGLSRIEPTRAKTMELSYNTVPTDESPFNPVLNDNVQYSAQPMIMKTNRVVSKYENNNPGNNNIALYDTHKYSLNCLNEPSMANNQMYNNLMAIAKQKVQLKPTDLMPVYGDPNSSNGSVYNPELPISSTNVVPPSGPYTLPANCECNVVSAVPIELSPNEEHVTENFQPYTPSKERFNSYFSPITYSHQYQNVPLASPTSTYSGFPSVGHSGYVHMQTSTDDNEANACMPPHGTIVENDYWTLSTNPYSTLNLDPRLNQFTNERGWNYPSTRSDIAYDLQRANFIKERNIRQHEADDALFRRTKKDRWVEPMMAYMNRERTPVYKLDQTTAREAQKLNSRNTQNPRQQKESFVNQRTDVNKPHYLNANKYNNTYKAIYSDFDPKFRKDMEQVYATNIPNMRVEQFTNDVDEAKGMYIHDDNMDPITKTMHRISDTIKNMFGWNSHGKRDTRNKVDNQLDYDDAGNVCYHDAADMRQYDVDTYMSRRELANSVGTKERFYYKPEHVLVINDGSRSETGLRPGKLVDAYPDDEGENLASSAVFVDKYNPNQVVRSLVMMDNNKLLLVRKYENDAIFAGDHRRMGEDLAVVELPIEAINKKFRDKLKKYNTGTNRDKVLNLTYDDFVELNKWVDEHPNKQKRVKREQLHYRVRTNDYDAKMIKEFDRDDSEVAKRVFVDSKVYNGLTDKYRKRMETKVKGRVDKDMYDQVGDCAGYMCCNPIPMGAKNDEHFSNYRQYEQKHVEQKSRSAGVRRGQFD